MSVLTPTLQALPILPAALSRFHHTLNGYNWTIEVNLKPLFPYEIKEVYKIFIPKNNDIVWCCLLAYMNSFDNVCDLVYNLSALKLYKNKSAAKKCVYENNPFLNRNKCLYDKNLQNIYNMLKQKVQSFLECHPDPSVHPNCRKLEATATILSCNILILFSPTPPNTPAQFSYFPQLELLDFDNFLIIYDDMLNGEEHFSFGMMKDIGARKQKQALREIVKRANLGKSTRQLKFFLNDICSFPDIDKNFLISLIKNRQENVILPLFKSPYIVSKLRDAGFSTNPRSRDEQQLSGLFHALCLEQQDTLYFLYDHAVSFCLDSDAPTRSPNSVTVGNLTSMKDELSSLRNMLLSVNLEKAGDVQDRIDEICQFNRFQTDICKDVTVFRLGINSYNLSETIFEASKRKSIVLSILKNYEHFFHWESLATEVRHFINFVRHGVLFEKLDFFCALLFFDNLYSLKERLKAPEKVYKNIESQFFFYVYSVKYFEFLKQIDSKYSDLQSTVIKMILFQERQKLLRNIQNFRKTVTNIEICETNVVKVLPGTEIENLSSLPEIYNEFFVLRIKSYLNTAISYSNRMSMKYILIIERALQVLGESMNSNNSEFNRIQNILCHSLPNELLKNLKKIRNSLSHLEDWQLSSRENAENYKTLFVSLQKELIELNNILKPIYATQKYAFDQFMLNMSLKAVGRCARTPIPENISAITKPHLTAALERPKNEEKNSDLEKNWKNCFDSIYDILKLRIASYNKNQKTFTSNNRIRFKYLLKNVLNAMRVELEAFQNDCPKSFEDKNMFRHYYETIRYFLKFLSTGKETVEHRREILNILRKGQSLFYPYKSGKREKNKGKSKPKVQTKPKAFASLYNNSLFQIEKENEPDNFSKEACYQKTEDKEICQSSDAELLNQVTLIDLSTQTEGERFTDWLVSIENVVEKIFNGVQLQSFPSQTFDQLKKLQLILTGHVFLSEKQKTSIKKNVAENFKHVPYIKEKFKSGTQNLSNEDMKQEILKLKLPKDTELALLKDSVSEPREALNYIDSMHDYYSELCTAMDINKIKKNRCSFICDKLQLPEDSQNILQKLIEGQNEKIRGDKLKFLKSRILILKSILIDDNADIKQLYERAKSKRTKAFIHEKLVHLYRSDSEFRASVEMILFDCMNILNTKELKNLWRKTSNLFNGINVRNVLAHGNPLLESLGKLLDPDDLPSELIRQMLQLVSDSDAIDGMLEILDKTGADFSGFMQIINSSDKTELTPLVEEVKKCDRWEKYAFLIPLKPEKSHSAGTS